MNTETHLSSCSYCKVRDVGQSTFCATNVFQSLSVVNVRLQLPELISDYQPKFTAC